MLQTYISGKIILRGEYDYGENEGIYFLTARLIPPPLQIRCDNMREETVEVFFFFTPPLMARLLQNHFGTKHQGWWWRHCCSAATREADLSSAGGRRPLLEERRRGDLSLLFQQHWPPILQLSSLFMNVIRPFLGVQPWISSQHPWKRI